MWWYAGVHVQVIGNDVTVALYQYVPVQTTDETGLSRKGLWVLSGSDGNRCFAVCIEVNLMNVYLHP